MTLTLTQAQAQKYRATFKNKIVFTLFMNVEGKTMIRQMVEGNDRIKRIIDTDYVIIRLKILICILITICIIISVQLI